jgi:hypothetical protein
VVAVHRQNQVHQLEDTWPIDGLCIYNYQLATQADRMDQFINPIRKDWHNLKLILIGVQNPAQNMFLSAIAGEDQ